MKKLHKFLPKNQSLLYKVSSRKKLADILGMTRTDVDDLVKNKLHYSEWDEPKRNGKGVRHIENPNPRLKAVQKRLNRLLAKIAVPSHLYCPVKGKSFAENASAHAGAQETKTIDVKDYFPSTLLSSVRRFWLEEMQCPLDIAETLTSMSCHNGHLPTGSPLSPILSFYANFNTWQAIANLCSAYGCKMTIYVDDLTLSGPRIPSSLIWKVRLAIRRAGLRHHKEKHFKNGTAEITGLISKNGKVMLPNRTLKIMHELRLNVSSERDVKKRKKLVHRLKSYMIHAQHVESANEK